MLKQVLRRIVGRLDKRQLENADVAAQACQRRRSVAGNRAPHPFCEGSFIRGKGQSPEHHAVPAHEVRTTKALGQRVAECIERVGRANSLTEVLTPVRRLLEPYAGEEKLDTRMLVVSDLKCPVNHKRKLLESNEVFWRHDSLYSWSRLCWRYQLTRIATICRVQPYFCTLTGAPMSSLSSPLPHPLKIAFLSSHALLDPTSGAALTVRMILESLAAIGQKAMCLTAACTDAPLPGGPVVALRSFGLQEGPPVKGARATVWQGRYRGVLHAVMGTRDHKRGLMTAAEELVFRNLAKDWLRAMRPDIVITYGGMLLDLELQRQVKAAGAKLVFYLANAEYYGTEALEMADMRLTLSRATAALYAQRLGIKVVPAGLFVEPVWVPFNARNPRYITLVNPVPQKGIAIFLQMAEKVLQRLPGVRFLVVETRGTLQQALARLPVSAALRVAIDTVPTQPSLSGVYSQTRVLCVPSVWFEAAGRVLVEAADLRIPVVASNIGGIPETLDGKGLLVDVPPVLHENGWARLSDEELAPWVDAVCDAWAGYPWPETPPRPSPVEQARALLPVLQGLVSGASVESA